MLLSRGVTAHGPALTQQYSPPGAEVTSLSLVKAAVDAKYIVVLFCMGLCADALHIGGVDC
jgi:hypothetical protein